MGPARISVDTGVTGIAGVEGVIEVAGVSGDTDVAGGTGTVVAVLFAVLPSETTPDDWTDSFFVSEALSGADLQEIVTMNNINKVYTEKIFVFIYLLLIMETSHYVMYISTNVFSILFR